MPSNEFQEFIAHCGGSFNQIDGRQVLNWSGMTSAERVNVFHPDCNIVQFAPERFCTVGELRVRGFDEQPRPQAVQAWPQMLSAHSSEFIPARAGGTSVASTGLASSVAQSPLRLPSAEVLIQQPARSQLTPLMRSASLGGRTVGSEREVVDREAVDRAAVVQATRIEKGLADAQTAAAERVRATAVIQLRQAAVNKLDDCPDFWKMSLDELLNWRDGVEITDPVVEEYFEAAVGVAEVDLEEALEAGLGSDAPERTGPARNPPRATRVQPEPQCVEGGFKFNKSRPTRADLLFMRVLEGVSPFGTPRNKGKAFHDCAKILARDHPSPFVNLSQLPGSRVLINRYVQLKQWLSAAESWSAMASGTHEDDEELRTLISHVQDEEKTCSDLRLASQEERQTSKNRSCFATDYREKCARGKSGIDGNDGSDSESPEDSKPEKRPKKKSRRSDASDGDEVSQETLALTQQMHHINEAALAAQREQNLAMNALFDRELILTNTRIENEKAAEDALAKHREAELAFQERKLEKESLALTKTEERIAGIEDKFSVIDSALSILLRRSGASDPST